MESKFCHTCGEQIAKSAPTCPKCGAPQSMPSFWDRLMQSPRKKTYAIALAFLFGAFGAHRFYLRRYLSGWIYLALSWTSLSVFLAVSDGFGLALQSDEKFDKKYNGGQSVNKTPSWVKVASGMCVAAILAVSIGIFVVFAEPYYQDYMRMHSDQADDPALSMRTYQYEPNVVTLHGKLLTAPGLTPDGEQTTFPAFQLDQRPYSVRQDASPLELDPRQEPNNPRSTPTALQNFV